jgi:Flp pilus assembly pilin Flp
MVSEKGRAFNKSYTYKYENVYTSRWSYFKRIFANQEQKLSNQEKIGEMESVAMTIMIQMLPFQLLSLQHAKSYIRYEVFVVNVIVVVGFFVVVTFFAAVVISFAVILFVVVAVVLISSFSLLKSWVTQNFNRIKTSWNAND